MEFITEIADKKTIQKQDIGINPFLIENKRITIVCFYSIRCKKEVSIYAEE